jgi:ABC-type multidrug transport system fused ATPase/permease subunit
MGRRRWLIPNFTLLTALLLDYSADIWRSDGLRCLSIFRVGIAPLIPRAVLSGTFQPQKSQLHGFAVMSSLALQNAKGPGKLPQDRGNCSNKFFKDVDFNAHHGQATMVVMGPSGSGKFTLIAALSGSL